MAHRAVTLMKMMKWNNRVTANQGGKIGKWMETQLRQIDGHSQLHGGVTLPQGSEDTWAPIGVAKARIPAPTGNRILSIMIV